MINERREEREYHYCKITLKKNFPVIKSQLFNVSISFDEESKGTINASLYYQFLIYKRIDLLLCLFLNSFSKIHIFLW